MKKFKLFLLFIFVSCLVGCASNEEKIVINAEKFSDVLVNNGFAVVDKTDSYKSESYILSAVSGTYGNVEISFFEYSNSDNAEKILEGHIETFNLRKSTGAATDNQVGKNFHKYILISNNYYMRSVRVGNTLVFCNTQLANKEIVEKIFESIDY